uniref:Class II aldolase/adducin N-terminal domain-containing protein n=2 Tax=Clytia hemisphaerica TaxID=252671 RepID=A0A7M5XD56_9CNID
KNAARFRTNVAYDIGGYDGIANQGENTEGKRLGQALGDKDVLVMGNHGLLTVGETIPMAYDRHYYFERAAETQVLAYQTGKPLSYLPDDVAKRTEEGIYAYVTKEVVAKHLNALRNVFMKEDPTFIDPKNSEYMEYVG